jgi:hypothetical protein
MGAAIGLLSGRVQIMRPFAPPVRLGSLVLLALLAWACSSKGTSRDAASNIGQADLATIADVSHAADAPGSTDSTPDGVMNVPDAKGADSGQDGAGPEAAGAGSGGNGSGGVGAGGRGQGGSGGVGSGGAGGSGSGGAGTGGAGGVDGGTFSCGSGSLSCVQGEEYCYHLVWGGGMGGAGSGPPPVRESYTCYSFQPACDSQRNCACICGTGGCQGVKTCSEKDGNVYVYDGRA